MSDTTAAPEGAAPATGGDTAPDLSSIKAVFAKAVGAEPEAEPKPEAGKPRGPDGKFAKPAEATEPEQEPEAKTEPEEPEPTKADHARFRAARRALKQREAAIEAREAEQRQVYEAERRIWEQVHGAHRAGKPLEMLKLLGIDPEDLAKQLTETAMGNDPAVAAMQRQLAQMEAQRERERLQAEQREAEQRIARGQQAFEASIAKALQTAGDPVLEAIAADPELVAEVRQIQERWYEEGDTDQRNPRAMRAAAKELAAKLESARTRLGRIFREKMDDAASETGAAKPSAAAGLTRRDKPDQRSTRTLGASQGAAKPIAPRGYDTTKESDRIRWKRDYTEALKNSSD